MSLLIHKDYKCKPFSEKPITQLVSFNVLLIDLKWFFKERVNFLFLQI